MAVGIVASASSGSQASVASFNISASLGTGAQCGLVFVATHNSSTDIITGVTWNGAAMERLYRAVDTDTEPGSVVAYFLNGVTNGAVTVSRTNNATVTVGYAASISALRVCRAFQTITRVASTQNTNADTSTTGTGASGEVAVDDGSPGTSSMRFAAAYTGAATPLGQGTNSTALQSLDSTALGSSFVRETTAGQGSRSVGFATGTTDDYAAVFVAVREEPAVQCDPGAASLALTGATPTVATPVVSLPTAGSMTLAGATPTVVTTNNVTVSPNAAAMTLTGATPAVATPVVSLPTEASLSLAGATPAVATPVAASPGAAALTLTPATPDVVAAQTYAPDAAALTLTGATPTVAAAQAYIPDLAALVLAFGTPTVTVSGGADVSVLPDAAALAFTLATPTVATTDNVYITPGPLGLVVTGAVPTVSGAQVSGGHGGRGGPRPLPPLPGPDADEAYLLIV